MLPPLAAMEGTAISRPLPPPEGRREERPQEPLPWERKRAPGTSAFILPTHPPTPPCPCRGCDPCACLLLQAPLPGRVRLPLPRLKQRPRLPITRLRPPFSLRGRPSSPSPRRRRRQVSASAGVWRFLSGPPSRVGPSSPSQWPTQILKRRLPSVCSPEPSRDYNRALFFVRSQPEQWASKRDVLKHLGRSGDPEVIHGIEIYPNTSRHAYRF